MKKRTGFVSNSSSSCFILNLKDEGVEELASIVKRVIGLPCGLNRCSAIAVGDILESYVEEYRLDWGADWGSAPLADWIQEWLDELGRDTVFIRASDEGMGGYVPEMDKIRELAVAEREAH